MKPAYDRDGVTIFHGRSEEIVEACLPEVDLLLCDPPYLNAYKSNRREVLETFGEIEGDDDEAAVREVLRQSWRKLKTWRHGYTFGPLSPADVVPEQVGGTAQLVWDKGAMSAGDLSCPWGASHEEITFSVKRFPGARSATAGALAARLRKGSVLRYSRAGETSREHPNAKPVDLLATLIETSSNRGEVVLDPFMGGGATLVAAVMTGRRAIGVEVDAKYAERAVARVQKAQRLMTEFRRECS